MKFGANLHVTGRFKNFAALFAQYRALATKAPGSPVSSKCSVELYVTDLNHVMAQLNQRSTVRAADWSNQGGALEDCEEGGDPEWA